VGNCMDFVRPTLVLSQWTVSGLCRSLTVRWDFGRVHQILDLGFGQRRFYLQRSAPWKVAHSKTIETSRDN